MLAGVQDVVTPAGAEAVVKETAPLKPPPDCSVTDEVPPSPVANEPLDGLAEMPKSGPAAAKNSTGDAAPTPPRPACPPTHTSSSGLDRADWLYETPRMDAGSVV